MIHKVLLATLVVILFSCNKDKKTDLATKTNSENVLLAEWTGPFGGVPAFDKMTVKNVEDAIYKAMELGLKDIDAITNNTEPPTFKNTIEEYERSQKELSRVFTYYGIYRSNLNNPEFRKLSKALAPKLSEYQSKINQNEKLFKRIKAVYENAKKNPLPNEEQRVVDLTYKQFEMNGSELSAEKKKRYAEINKELSKLYTTFSNNVLHDEENYITYLTKEQLGGLPKDFIKSAAKIAEENDKKGMYAITNTRSSMDPFLTYSTERDLRKKVWENYYSRGDNNDEYDNKNIIAKILKLRQERVNLLGYDNYAQWRLQNRMAKTPENALNLMQSVWPAATARVKEEVADMQAIANKEGKKIKIEPWDYRYYAEKVRKKKYDLDGEEIKQYLQLDKLREGMFFVAGELFNFKFKPIAEGTVPIFHEDVKVWEVVNKNTGKHIGLWYLDPYARAGKSSGAWATTYREFTSFDGPKNVLCSNNSNFVKPAPGEPLLVSWDDAETFFHEFGHALHFLSTNVKYPTLNNGVRDYTEFQSQLLEKWLTTDKVINQFLVHYKTGKPMPKALVEKIKKASTFNEGFKTTEYLASALMDMKLHTADSKNINMNTFEKETLSKMNMPKELPMRHRTPHFGHVFSGEGYATAYYGYMWADVLTSDAAEAFRQAPNGFYDKDLSKKLVDYLFSPRNTIDPSEAYKLFRGRDAKIDAFMKDKGFPVKK